MVKEVKATNIKSIATSRFSTSLAKFNVKAKPSNPDTNKPIIPYTLKPKETINIDLAGYEGKDLPVYTEQDIKHKSMFINTVSAVKRNGKYELMYNGDKNIAVIYQYLGYKTQKNILNITNFPYINDVKLIEENFNLSEVVVTNGVNPADEIIRNAIYAGRYLK